MAGRKRGVKTPRLEVPLPPFKMSQQWGSLVSLAQHVVDMCAKNDLAVGKALLQLVAREASRNVQWWDNSEGSLCRGAISAIATVPGRILFQQDRSCHG